MPMSDKKKEPRFHGEVSEKSHKNMSRIREKDTSIEVTLRKALWNKGYRYRKNLKDLPGRPDIALTKYKMKSIGGFGSMRTDMDDSIILLSEQVVGNGSVRFDIKFLTGNEGVFNL